MKKIFLLFLLTLLLVGCSFSKKETPINDEISNTTWVSNGDCSEMIFGETKFNWYQEEGVHNDNYYSGTFEYYRGSKAVEFITTELSQYGVTREELNELFARNKEYSEDNFVVFNLVYDKLVMNSEETSLEKSLIPWYGFILKDGTYLDVANMNNGSYYAFVKQKKDS